MKGWILAIFKLRCKLIALTDGIDKKIAVSATSFSACTKDNIQSIMTLIDVKRRLVNLEVLYKKMLVRLDLNERELLKNYAAGMSLADIAESEHFSRCSVYRYILRAFSKCISALEKCGYNADKLESEYMDIYVVRKTYLSAKRRLKSSGTGTHHECKTENSPNPASITSADAAVYSQIT